MKININFLNTLKETIREVLRNNNPLLDAPVPSRQEVMVENKINKILNASGKKNVGRQD
tara:strand:+ start:22 stop:198 length:177 start_codon:yes stop_codon:yes gene_type:complete